MSNSIWTGAFWKATAERCVRGAAVTIGAVWFGGDFVFDSFNLNAWSDVAQLGVSGAVGSLILSLIGNAATGNGPALTNAEVLDPDPPG